MFVRNHTETDDRNGHRILRARWRQCNQSRLSDLFSNTLGENIFSFLIETAVIRIE